jgi:hypothetical protein
MSRVKKLRGAIQGSRMPERERDLLVGAINKCLAHLPHKPAKTSMETLLAFGARQAGARTGLTREQETQFRLYARTAILLLGYLPLPAQTDAATQLRKDANKHYGDVAWAQARYRRYKSLAAVVQSTAPVAIVDLEEFVAQTHLGEGVVSARVNAAVRVGNEAMAAAIRDLKGRHPAALGHAQRWFGDGTSAQLLKNLQALHARSTDPMRPIFLEYEVQDVWGTSHSSSRSINFGRKFFDDAHTLPTSRLGREYIANDEQVRNVREVTREYELVTRRLLNLEAIRSQLAFASRGDTLADIASVFAQEKVDLGQAKGRSAPQVRDEILADVRALGLADTDDGAAIRGKLTAADARIEADKAALRQRQGDFAVMEVTGFGCYVHELSHMVLGTQDLDSAVVGAPGQKVYGPLLCQMLAQEKPQQALDNADNYRHFIECWVA